MACIGPVVKAGVEEGDSLSAMEVAVKAMLHEVGGEVMRQWLEGQDEKNPAAERGCV
jgi:hypothetical protein